MAMLNEKTQRMFKQELRGVASPRSGDHLVRIVLGALVSGIGAMDVFVHVLTQRSWDLYGVIVALAMVFGGLGIIFTKTVIEIAKSVLPWTKGG